MKAELFSDAVSFSFSFSIHVESVCWCWNTRPSQTSSHRLEYLEAAKFVPQCPACQQSHNVNFVAVNTYSVSRCQTLNTLLFHRMKMIKFLDTILNADEQYIVLISAIGINVLRLKWRRSAKCLLLLHSIERKKTSCFIIIISHGEAEVNRWCT